jgi:hypothetical protein
MKSTYPVRVPPCPGCSRPESCGACWLKLSNADQQRTLAGVPPKGRTAVLRAVPAVREAVSEVPREAVAFWGPFSE